MKRRTLFAASAVALRPCAGASLGRPTRSPQATGQPSRCASSPPSRWAAAPKAWCACWPTSCSRCWGQPVTVENRPGGNGFIAIDAFKRGAKDGHDLIQLDNVHLVAYPYLFKKLPYDPKDFEQIDPLFSTTFFFTVATDSKYKTVGDIVADAKANPGKLNYGSWSVGNPVHLGSALFESVTGTQMAHVIYKETSQLYTGVATGELSFALGTFGTSRALQRAGKLRYLAVAAPQRHAALPTCRRWPSPAARRLRGHRLDDARRAAGPACRGGGQDPPRRREGAGRSRFQDRTRPSATSPSRSLRNSSRSSCQRIAALCRRDQEANKSRSTKEKHHGSHHRRHRQLAHAHHRLRVDKNKQNDPVWAPIFEGYEPVAAVARREEARRAVRHLQRPRHLVLLRPLLGFALGVGERTPWPTKAAVARDLPPVKGHPELARTSAARSWPTSSTCPSSRTRRSTTACSRRCRCCGPHEPDWPAPSCRCRCGVLQFPIPSARRCYKLGPGAAQRDRKLPGRPEGRDRRHRRPLAPGARRARRLQQHARGTWSSSTCSRRTRSSSPR